MKTFSKFFTTLVIIMVLCAAIVILLPLFSFPPTMGMVAEKLSNKPEEYFVVMDADPVLSQAIAHLGESVPFYSLDTIEFDDLRDQHGTSNIEYQNNYYRVDIFSVTPKLSYELSIIFWISFFSFIVSTILLTSLIIHKRFRLERKKQNLDN